MYTLIRRMYILYIYGYVVNAFPCVGKVSSGVWVWYSNSYLIVVEGY